MELANGSYPVRAFIRHKAEVKLRKADNKAFCPQIDRVLLRDLATLFRSSRGNAVYMAYATRAEAEAIEERVATELYPFSSE